MPYELSVTEVGPAEYPLIEVLRETVFSEFWHRSHSTIAEDLEGRQDVLALIAHLEGNPIGFKVGYHFGPGVFYSKCGGVLKDYRGHGLGRRMQEWQHQFARSRGYRQVFFNTFNHFRQMILFGLASGFHPVAAEWREPPGVMSFKFVKDLTREGTAPTDYIEALSADDRTEVACDDVARLHGLVSRGYHLTGIRHDSATAKALVALERSATSR